MGKWRSAGLQWSLLLTDVSDRDIAAMKYLPESFLTSTFLRLQP